MADAQAAPSSDQRRANNREAARVSRMRKKARLDELQRTVVFLTRENAELREQNEIVRRILSREVDSSVMDLLEHMRNENQALKVALYDTVQALATSTGALERGMPHAGAAIAAAVAEGAVEDGAAPGGAGAAMASLSSSSSSSSSAAAH